MIRRSPVRTCPWSLTMKDDPAQLPGRLFGFAIDLSMYVLDTKEQKIYILQRIGFVKFYNTVGITKSRLLSYKINFTWYTHIYTVHRYIHRYIYFKNIWLA